MLNKIFRKKYFILSVFDRIILLEILNRIKLDFIVEKVINDIKEQLSFSDKELFLLDIQSKNGEVIWKTEEEKDKKIYLGGTGLKIIKDCLTELKNNDMFSEEHMSLYNKFNCEE